MTERDGTSEREETDRLLLDFSKPDGVAGPTSDSHYGDVLHNRLSNARSLWLQSPLPVPGASLSSSERTI